MLKTEFRHFNFTFYFSNEYFVRLHLTGKEKHMTAEVTRMMRLNPRDNPTVITSSWVTMSIKKP